MRILLIRHGDPDYVNDTLTEKGRREAALLAKRAVSMNTISLHLEERRIRRLHVLR